MVKTTRFNAYVLNYSSSWFESVLPKNYEVCVWADDEDIENIEDINIEGSTNKDGNYMGKYNISCGFECVIEIRK